MRRLLLLSVFFVGVADHGLAQRGGRTVTKQPAAQPADGQERGKAEDKGQPPAPAPGDAVAALRRAFGEEYFQRKGAAGEELAAAREQAGQDEAAFAAARTEIARRYRGELAALRAAYAEKAKGLGVSLELPGDDLALEKLAAEVAPAAALRADFTNQVAQLAAAAQKELAELRTSAGADDAAAFAARRTEIARKYRGQVVALQQAFSQKAAGLGLSVDVTDVSKVMGAIAAAEAAAPAPAPAGPAPAGPAPAPAGPAPAKPQPAPAPAQPNPGPPPAGADAGAQPAPQPAPKGAPKPIDAETLRKAFAAQVDALRGNLAAELAALEAAEKGDALAAKRAALVAKHREQLASYRATVQARAQAAGVTLTLPTDAELVPELGTEPAPTPKEGPPADAPPKGGPEAKPAERPTEAPPRPAPGPGGKSGRGPRFGGGG